MLRFIPPLFALAIVCCTEVAAGNVVVTRDDVSLSFESAEANFAPRIRTAGVSGFLVYSNPVDACSSLESQVITAEGSRSSFLLTVRGNCSFDTKVRNAQETGFSAVIVFDNEYSSDLLTMAGSSEDIKIYAVFVTREAGEILAGYADDVDTQVFIRPSYEDTVWSIVVFSFIAVLAIAAAVATCFIVRRHRNRLSGSGSSWPHEPCGMSSRVVKAMPAVIYKATGSQKAAQEACAICLEDYLLGEKLRILPCCHRFHSSCVDTWLTMWQTLCPVCKHDARVESPEFLASDRTPLLSSTGNFISVSCGSTAHASPSESSAIQIPATQSGFLDTPSSSQGTPYSSSQHLISCPGSPLTGSPATSPISSRCSAMTGSRTPHANGFSYLGSYSLEAFRASPYFTPPSVARNPSPVIPGTYATPYLLDCSPSSTSSSSLPCGSRSKSFLHSTKTHHTSQLTLES